MCAEKKPDPLEKAGPVHTLLSEKYYVDALYDLEARRIGVDDEGA